MYLKMDRTGSLCVSNYPDISLENEVNICVLILREFLWYRLRLVQVAFGADLRKLLLTIEQREC